MQPKHGRKAQTPQNTHTATTSNRVAYLVKHIGAPHTLSPPQPRTLRIATCTPPGVFSTRDFFDMGHGMVMSTRAIAPIVGVSDVQVHRDVKHSESLATYVAPDPLVDESTGEVLDLH